MHVGLVYPYGISNFINKIMEIEISTGQLNYIKSFLLVKCRDKYNNNTCISRAFLYLNISYAESFRIYEYKIHSFLRRNKKNTEFIKTTHHRKSYRFLHRKNNFVQISKNLIKYRAENNFLNP